MKEALQHSLVVLNRGQFGDDRLVQLDGVLRSEIAQAPVLQPTPDGLDWIEDRCVGRELLQAQPIRAALRQLVDRIPLVHTAPVPHDHDTAGQLLEQGLKEGGRLPIVEIAVDQGREGQAQAVPAWRQPEGRRDGDLLTLTAGLVQLRRLPAGCPRAPDQRRHEHAALVNQGERGLLSPSLFLMRGHWVVSHWWIASGSRSRGTRWGFWGVKPRSRIHAVRYRGWRRTANSCWIRWANRGSVQSSVGNPCSEGFSVNQRRMIFSWVVVSFRGRPAAGRAASPCSPCRRKAATHRRTVAPSTPRKSATSWVAYPSKTRWTASRRRCSNSVGEPMGLMSNSIQN